MNALWQDVRFGLRMLAKNPGFTVIAMLTLALGIGANTAIFTVIDAALIRPLPYPQSERIVALYLLDDQKQDDNLSPADFLDFHRTSTSFSGLAAYRESPLNLASNGQPERVAGANVTSDFFGVLGVPALHGRTISPEIDRPGSATVVVVSYGLWQRSFGGDPGIVGKALEIDGEERTVVGIMPPGFSFPMKTELWASSRFAVIPHPLRPSQDSSAMRDSHYFDVIGRLKPTVSAAQASAEVNAIGQQLKAQYRDDEVGTGARVIALRQDLVGDTRAALLILLGAVALVLLIAVANVANLLLARGATRQKEIAIRRALGAGRGAIVRQLLVESLLLAGAGGTLGVLLAYWGVVPLRQLVPPSMIGAARITMDTRVLGFAALVSIGSGILFGLMPGLRLSRWNRNEVLKEAVRGTGDTRRAKATRKLLVVTEIALAAILLTGAGLLIRSFSRLLTAPKGFDGDQLLTLGMSLPEARYPNTGARANFVQEVVRRVEGVPGVASVAAISRLPLNPGNSTRSMEIQGRAVSRDDPTPDYLVATPNYFETMRIPLRRGRTFTQRDATESTRAVIVSQATAERFWPGHDAVGQLVRVGVCGDEKSWCEVVGVVGDIRQHRMGQKPRPAVYVPYTKDPWTPVSIVVRSKVDAASIGTAVEAAIHSVDPEEPVYDKRSMEKVEQVSLSPERLQLVLLGLFAMLALTLACMGIYGVMAYFVAQRTGEIGVRMALGAQAGDVLGMVVREGLGMSLIGTIAGLAGSLFATRILSGLLFGVSTSDPLTFASVGVVLMSVALIACYVPARRATQVDPLVALRYE